MPVTKDVQQQLKTKQPSLGKSSRKGKKAWRKNVDVEDVEGGLEEKRDQERFLGSAKLLKDQESATLFFTDKAGDSQVKRSLRSKTLKMEEILRPKSAVQGLQSRLTGSSTILCTDGAKPRQVSKSLKHRLQVLGEKKRAQGALPGSYAALKAREKAAREEKKKTAKGGYGLWDEVEPVLEDVKEKETKAYLEPAMKKPVKKPILPARPSANLVPQVETAHAGASYRPTTDSHQALLQAALDEEEKKIAFKAALDQKLSFPPELSLLPDEEVMMDDDEEEEEENNTMTDGVNSMLSEAVPADPTEKAIPQRRKTRAEKNRALRKAALEKAEEKLKDQKRLGKQINRIAEIQKEIGAAENAAAAVVKPDESAQELLDKVRIGPYKFRPSSIPIQLTEELSDNLRLLKPEGNLFKDRFESLQKRRLIETRIPVSKKRKYKLKETESHDYKRFK